MLEWRDLTDYIVEETASSHQEISITTLKQKSGNQVTWLVKVILLLCYINWDFSWWIFPVDIIVPLTVLVQYYDLPWQLFYWYDNFAELIIHLFNFVLVMQLAENLRQSFGQSLNTTRNICSELRTDYSK